MAKAEILEDNIRKDGAKARTRTYPPVQNLGTKSKVSTPATFNILSGKSPHPKEVKDSALTSINRQAKPPARSPASQSLEISSMRRLSGDDFIGSPSPSLHSTITEPAESTFFVTPHTPVRSDGQTQRPRVGIPLRIPEITFTAKDFSSSPIISGRDPSGRTLSNASIAISEAVIGSGRASPTLSELSQEEQFLDSDAESDNTGAENKVHPVCEETDMEDRVSPINCNSHVTVSRNNGSNLAKSLHGVPGSKGASDAHRVRSVSVSEVNECEAPGSGSAAGIIGSPLRWRRGQAIGEGTFGRVYKGKQ